MSRVAELEAAVRELDSEAQTVPDHRGGAAFLYRAGAFRYRLTLTAPCIVRNTFEGADTPAALPAGLTLPAWVIRDRSAEARA